MLLFFNCVSNQYKLYFPTYWLWKLEYVHKVWCKFVGQMTEELQNFLSLNFPSVGKKPKFSLGVSEPKLGSHIFEVTKIPCQSNEFVLELLRGVRLHIDRFIENLKVACFVYSLSFSTSYCVASLLMYCFLFKKLI